MAMIPGFPQWLLPFRLAWRQLRAEQARLATAIAGVMFASVLILMQIGFRAALFETATALPNAFRGDLFLINPLTQALFRAEPIPRVRAHQVLAAPEVEQVTPISLTQLMWRNPVTGAHRAVEIIGFDTESGAVGLDGLAVLVDALKRNDTLAFDALSRPEFGDIPGLLARDGMMRGQLGNHAVDVVGTFRLGTTFAADGNVVVNETTFWRLARDVPPDTMGIAAIRLKPGADVMVTRDALRSVLPHDVDIVTRAELRQREHNYWDDTTPIGAIFLFVTVIGILVGTVIVYQILFTDVTNHLGEYATLKAIGFSNWYLSQVVIAEAIILAALGFVPGAAISLFVYQIASNASYLTLTLTGARCFEVFLIIVGMCITAALLAVRKAREANPADIF
jgi:putative ABC transport system permease protein